MTSKLGSIKPNILTSLPTGSLLAGGLLLVTALGLSLHMPGSQGIGSAERQTVFVCFCFVACLIYGRAVQLAMRRSIKLWLVLLVAGLLRLLVLAAPPFLSTDLYRYVWDGRVQLHGINPYQYVPAAPELTALRDKEIFSNINRPDYAVTIYPPVAQMIFRLLASVGQSPYIVKTAMMLFDGVTIAVLWRLLSATEKPASQILIYAWHPLPVWEFAGNGHIDAAAVCFISVGLLCLFWRRPAMASVALAAAVLVKFLPAVLLPAVWHRLEGRWLIWRAMAVFTAFVVAAYLLYASVGWHVLGFLPGYAAEEGISHETRLFPLAVLSQFVALPGWAGAAYYGGAACVLLALGAAVARGRWQNLPDAAALDRVAGLGLLLATLMTVAVFPHYPWYFAWLLLPCTLVPTLSVLYLTSAAFTIYLASYDESLLWPCLIYVPFFLLGLRDLVVLPRSHRLQRS